MSSVKPKTDASYLRYLAILCAGGDPLGEDGRAAFLHAFGSSGRWSHGLLPAIRQAAAGNPDAEADIADILGVSAASFIAYLKSAEGAARRAEAEAFMEAGGEKAVEHVDIAPRQCWIPVFGGAALEPTGSKFGGDTAWAESGFRWPHHYDGGPMSLIFQFDIDTLPAAFAARLGKPGHLFQFFTPTGGLRGMPESDTDRDSLRYPFVVRIVSKAVPGGEISIPDRHPEDVQTVPVSAVIRWAEQTDIIYGSGAGKGGYHVTGDKLGGWPSIGPGRGFPGTWDHLFQVSGGGVPGDALAADSHGWVVRAPDGSWRWTALSG